MSLLLLIGVFFHFKCVIYLKYAWKLVVIWLICLRSWKKRLSYWKFFTLLTGNNRRWGDKICNNSNRPNGICVENNLGKFCKKFSVLYRKQIFFIFVYRGLFAPHTVYSLYVHAQRRGHPKKRMVWHYCDLNEESLNARDVIKLTQGGTERWKCRLRRHYHSKSILLLPGSVGLRTASALTAGAECCSMPHAYRSQAIRALRIDYCLQLGLRLRWQIEYADYRLSNN